MRGLMFCVAFVLTAAVGAIPSGAIPSGAMTVDEVIAKNVEARGGDSWDEIDSMKIKPGHKYLLDAFFVDSRRQVGLDGQTAWSNDENGPEEIEGLDRAILFRESDFPNPFFSYENDGYEVTQIDNRRNQLNVQEGGLGEDGKLVVSNVDTGTSWTTRGSTIHGRVSFYDVTDAGFKVEYETSTDGGENWFVNARTTYTRGEQQ